MKALEFIISKNGTLIYPTEIQISEIDKINTSSYFNQITCSFYEQIQTSDNGVITPINPVTIGLSGKISFQCKPYVDSLWCSIPGVLNISDGEICSFPIGIITSLNVICDTIVGCEYILIRLDRGI